MPEVLIEDEEELIELRNELKTATDQLLAERSAAIAAFEEPKIKAAETEFDRIGVVLATVQGVINRNEAIKLDLLADRLNESIAAQRAVGLSLARQTLEEVVARLGRVAEFVAVESAAEVEGVGEPAASENGGTSKPTSDLLRRLITVYKGEKIRHPQLRAVTLAQWMLESGRGKSELAKQHLNFGGLKWRQEMSTFATKVSFKAHDGVDNYCKFATLENFVNGYWAFLNRAPYSGWEEHVGSSASFIGFIGPIYSPSAGYVEKVMKLVPEAAALLSDASPRLVEVSTTGAVDLGTIVIDPGHGGTSNVPGSSANNAIAKSGVKEKKLTLDFAMLLQSEFRSQAAKAGEQIKVVLTRATDVNVTGAKRAGAAFDHEAKLFLSIHFNGGAAATRGTETFYRAPENENLNLADDMAFAKDVQDAVFGAIQALDDKAVDRGIKPDTMTKHRKLSVLSDVQLGNHRRRDMCRAALVEIEFISNPTADKLLVSGPNAIGNRTKVMAALARRVRKHMKDMTASATVAEPSMVGTIVQKLQQQIAAGRIIFDSEGLQDQLLGRNDGIKVTKKLQALVLTLSELAPSRIRVSSLIRAGTHSHHGSGQAVDIGNEEIAAALLPVIATNAKVAELGIDELIFDAALAGHQDRNKWNYDEGAKHNFDPATLDAHGNHIHFAVTA